VDVHRFLRCNKTLWRIAALQRPHREWAPVCSIYVICGIPHIRRDEIRRLTAFPAMGPCQRQDRMRYVRRCHESKGMPVPHYEARTSSKGQITIPAAVREFFKLKAGDIVDFYIDEKSRSVEIIARNKPVGELFGMLNKHVDQSAGPLTQTDIDEAIADHLAEDDARIMRQWNQRREFEEGKRARKTDAAE
jgi:antitoxin PrlF